MGTESHGGDGGPLEDREDGDDDTVTAPLLLDPKRRRAASVPEAGGGRAAHCEEESSQLHEEKEQVVQEEKAAVKRPDRAEVRYLRSSGRPSVRGFKRRSALLLLLVTSRARPRLLSLSLHRWTSSRSLLPVSP